MRYLLLFFALFLVGCSEQPAPATITVFAAPIGAIVRSVAGDALPVYVVVPAGKDVHEYEPSPGNLAALGRGGVYIDSGLPPERRLARLVEESGGKTVVIGADIERMMSDHGHDHEHADGDPHIWMSPANAKKLTLECAEALARLFPEHAEAFARNTADAVAELDELESEMVALLNPYAGRSFYAYHPAFGYFAAQFGLEQHAIEVDGKAPTPRQLEGLMLEMRGAGVTRIYAGDQFNLSVPQACAAQLNATLITLDPLPADLVGGLRDIAKKLAVGFAEEDARSEK